MADNMAMDTVKDTAKDTARDAAGEKADHKAAHLADDRLTPAQHLVDKTKQETEALYAHGVRISGNAFSPLLYMAVEFDDVSTHALKAAHAALKLAPEHWCEVELRSELTSPCADEGEQNYLMRLVIATLSPAVVVCCDSVSASALVSAYAHTDAEIGLPVALVPGEIRYICGFACLALGDVSASLTNEASKQQLWFFLKRLQELM